MSFDALRMAFAVPVKSSAERLVLLAYANHCGSEDWIAYPSRECLHQSTQLDPKTISSAVKSLVTKGLLVDTGARKGITGRVRVYRLCTPNVSESGTIQSAQKRIALNEEMDPTFPANASENGSLNRPKNGTRNQVLNLVGTRERDARTPGVGSPLPPDWKPDLQTEAWAREARPDLNYEDVLAKFVAHAIANAWKRADWSAAFQKWVLDERRSAGKGQLGGSGNDRTWTKGAEPDRVIVEALHTLGLDPWSHPETHGQARRRVTEAGGEHLLLPKNGTGAFVHNPTHGTPPSTH